MYLVNRQINNLQKHEVYVVVLLSFVMSGILLLIDVNESLSFHDSDFTLVMTISGDNTALLLSYKIFLKKQPEDFFSLIDISLFKGFICQIELI